MAEAEETAIVFLRNTLQTLRKPIPSFSELTTLLAAPLAFFDALSVDHPHYKTADVPKCDSRSMQRYIPQLQDAILHFVIPTWQPQLEEENLMDLVNLYFAPSDLICSTSVFLVINGYTNLVAALPEFPDYTTNALTLISQRFGPRSILEALLRESSDHPARCELSWRDYLQAVFSIPGKVTNILKDDTPDLFANGSYYRIFLSEAALLIVDKTNLSNSLRLGMLVSLLAKLVGTGFFPMADSPDQLSFFVLNKEVLRKSVPSAKPESGYNGLLSELVLAMPSLHAQKIFASFVGCLKWKNSLQTTPHGLREVRKNGCLLFGTFGSLGLDSTETWDLVTAVVVERTWPEDVAQAMIYWAGETGSASSQELLIKRTLEVWQSPQHIKYSLLSKHRFLTVMLIMAVAQLPPSSFALKDFSTSETFLEAINIYIGHPDVLIRRCGMLVAEFVAQKLGRNLDFGDWDGDDHGRDWCRSLRNVALNETIPYDEDLEEESITLATTTSESIEADSAPEPEPKPKPKPTITYDSDDSLTGYISDSDDSRAPSPTAEELAEIEKHPSLVIGRKRIPKPVYLVQLAELLLPEKTEEKNEPDRVEMALREGSALVRRKKGYGSELEENAANLSVLFINLRDNYDLSLFWEQRQDILNALIACCPEQAAPCMIEQFFIGQHAIDTRSAILSALVTGGRELAGFAQELQPAPQFASTMLPPAMHRKYISQQDQPPAIEATQRIMEGISRTAIDRTRNETEQKIPQIVREKRLRVRQRGSVREVNTVGHRQPASDFGTLAAEAFIMPMINRFWVYLRDEQQREVRGTGKGAGTGIILDPQLLAQFLMTLGILMHAAQNTPAFLAVLAPEALELAVSLAVSRSSAVNAVVLAAALELSLLTLDASWELDQGRTLGLDHPRLLLSLQQWIKSVFEALDQGLKVRDGGGEAEDRIKRSSAGALLVLEEIIGKWRGVMIHF